MSLQTPPTAIMGSNNKLLLGILQGLDERNVKIPEQVSIIGFDDYIWNRYFSPSVTSVAQATEEMGKSAFDLLLQIIARKKGVDLSSRHVRLAAELRVRNSTAPPSHSRSAVKSAS